MAILPKLNSDILRQLCDVMGHTADGLTNTKIDQFLQDLGIQKTAAGFNKRTILFETLNATQNSSNSGNHAMSFVLKFVSPVHYLNDRNLHVERLGKINEILSFAGYHIDNSGSLREATATRTIEQAQERAGRLRRKLVERSVHEDVLSFCRAELLQENYFHSVLEATKSVAEKIRQKTGLTSDGDALVNAAFGLGSNNTPKLAFNTLLTESEQSEHKGFANLLRGTFGMFRNVTAHAPRLLWAVNEVDAVDALTLASLLHKWLDRCVPTGY